MKTSIIICILSLLPLFGSARVNYPAKGRYKAVAAGEAHVMVIKEDGTLWGWGCNENCQLGTGDTIDRASAVKILDRVTAVAAGGCQTFAVRDDGSLWGWGYFGPNPRFDKESVVADHWRASPVKILEGVKSVSAGGTHAAILCKDGSLWTLGWNNCGQLGDGSRTYRPHPVKVLDNVKSVATGTYHTLALLNDGTLLTWGSNNCGQLGTGNRQDQLKPIKILADVKKVEAGGNRSLAIRNNGTLWEWGFNDSQNDGPTNSFQLEPKQIWQEVSDMAAGSFHAMAIKSDGSLWGWGANDYGQLGNGTDRGQGEFVKIADAVKCVACGHIFTIFLTRNGDLMLTGKVNPFVE